MKKYPRFDLKFFTFQAFFIFTTKTAWAFTNYFFWIEKIEPHCTQGRNELDYLNLLLLLFDALTHVVAVSYLLIL